MFSIKAKFWEYEREALILRTTPGAESLDRKYLQQVCFGLETAEADVALITKIIRQSGYDLTLCRMVRCRETDFGIKPEEIQLTQRAFVSRAAHVYVKEKWLLGRFVEMHKIKLITVFTTTFLISGCYQWRGELNTRITGLSLKPGGNVVAIGIVEHYSRYPLLNMSGWSRGVPKIQGRKGRVYFYNIKEKKVEEKLSVKFPKEWDAGDNEIGLHIWEGEGIYFKLTGCPKMNQNCNEVKYYHLLSNGKIDQVNELPKFTKEYSKSLMGNTAYRTYNNDILAVSIGHSGAWVPVLTYKNHKLLPVDEKYIM